MIRLLLILLLGLGLRLIGINKTQGLWNDEYISWFVASHPFGQDFFREIFAQCHMPFYYLYLKFFMYFGGDSDLFLRLTSVFVGILSIIAMYFVGLQNNKKTGIICALFAAISSFLIYYSQEVRMYSLLFFISAMALLYFLKLIKNRTWTNLIGLILFDFLIIFTHTIGFVYVFFQLIALTYLLFKEYKKQLLAIWGGLIVLGGICTPQITHILGTKSFSQWWGHFSLSKIGFLFTDYFSPVLTNLVNAPDKFIYVKSFSFIFFTIIPTIIAIAFIGKSLYKNRENISLASICLGTTIILASAAILGRLVFITKYSIEIYPILMYLAAFGACSFNNKKLANVFISIFCAINLTYLITSPASAPKIPRTQGHKIVADLLNKGEIKENDYIILQYYPPVRYEKYFDFSKYNVITIHKGNFPSYILPDKNYQDVLKDGKALYKEIFAGKRPSYIDYDINENIIKNLKSGQNVFAVMPDSVAIYSPTDLENIAGDSYLYEKTPIMYMIFSYIRNRVFADFSKSLTVTRFEKMGDWSVIRFTKLNK